MSLTNLCRLCLNACSDCKQLYSETGLTNEIYEIAVKYFHPMFLSMDQENQNIVMCLKCWDHIWDFHSYQQSVFLAQRKLFEESQMQMELQSGQCTTPGEIANCDVKIKKEEPADSLSDIELMEEDMTYGEMIQNYENNDTSNITTDTINDKAIKSGLENGEQIKDQSISVEGICQTDNMFNSDANQLDNTLKRKRTHRKSQTELDSIISQWRPNLECVACGVLEPNFQSLQQHFRQQHPNEECYVTCCNRKLNKRHKIEAHARLHQDPNAFKCPKCEIKLSSESSLYKHKMKCGVERIITKTPTEEMDNFIALCKPNLDCELCHESSPRFTALKTHFRDKHPDEDFYVMCCQRKFDSRIRFKEHIWLHMDPNAFKCKICGKHQTRFNGLKMHMERMHSIPQKTIRPEDIKMQCAEMQSKENLSPTCSNTVSSVTPESSNIKLRKFEDDKLQQN